MKQTVRPLTEPREFALHELFFSITDEKGRITYGNHVFTRISGYLEADLVGAPHSIVRHPDMPRAVFKLLWDYLQAGRTIAAYVKNLAQDGRYYWVLALVSPCAEGYLSVRLKPSCDLLPRVQQVYREALAVEAATEKAGGDRRSAMAASTALILQRLSDLGYASYDAFMRDALAEELASRRARLGEGVPALPLIERPTLSELGQNSRRIGDTLQQVFAALGLFKQLHGQLSDASARLFDMAETLHFESLNAKIAAGKLDHGAAVLGAVSRELSDASQETESLITRFRDATEPVTDLIGELILDTGAARLEAEICEMFAAELDAVQDVQHDALQEHALQTLLTELSARGASVDRRLTEMYHRMEAINSLAIKIVARVNELKAVQFAGTKEALSRREAAGFIHIFKTVGQRIADGKRDCAQLLETIQQCRRRGRDFACTGPEMRSLLEAIAQYPGLREAPACCPAEYA